LILFGRETGLDQAGYPILDKANLFKAKLTGSYLLTVTTPQDSLVRQVDGQNRVPKPSMENSVVSGVTSSEGYGLRKIEFFGRSPVEVEVNQIPLIAGVWIKPAMDATEALQNLYAARNLKDAELPEEIKQILFQNGTRFSHSPHPTPCTPSH
jgi:hypothetical protein